jgi:hypothetical protein
MMNVMPGAGRRSGLVVGLNVAVDGVGMPAVRASRGVEMRGWKPGKTKHPQHRKARHRPPQATFQNHGSIIGADAARVKLDCGALPWLRSSRTPDPCRGLCPPPVGAADQGGGWDGR